MATKSATASRKTSRAKPPKGARKPKSKPKRKSVKKPVARRVKRLPPQRGRMDGGGLTAARKGGGDPGTVTSVAPTVKIGSPGQIQVVFDENTAEGEAFFVSYSGDTHILDEPLLIEICTANDEFPPTCEFEVATKAGSGGGRVTVSVTGNSFDPKTLSTDLFVK